MTNQKNYPSWLRGLDLLVKDETRSCITLEEAQAMIEAVGITAVEEESTFFLRFLSMMGKIAWYEEGGLRDTIITDPIEYLAIPASRVACKLKPTGSDRTTHANEPHHKKAARKMTQEWNVLRDKGVLDVKLLDVLWEEFIGRWVGESRRKVMGKVVPSSMVHWKFPYHPHPTSHTRTDRTPELILLMVKFSLFVPLQVPVDDGTAGSSNRHGRARRVVPVEQTTQFLVPALLPTLKDSGEEDNLDLEWLGTSHTFYLVNRTMQHEAMCRGHHRLTSSIRYRHSHWAPTPRKSSYRSLTFQADSSRTACSHD